MTSTPDINEPIHELPSGIALTPFNPAFAEGPHKLLDRLREQAPVHQDDQFHRIVLTRHDDVAAVLRDRDLSVDPRKAAAGTFMSSYQATDDREPSILLLDAPEHTRLRALVNRAFTPRAVEQMAPRIESIALELLDEIKGVPSFDLISAFAGPLPTIVIAEMLGVDPADRLEFKRWSDIGVSVFDPTLSVEERARVDQAMAELDDYFSRAIADRRDSRRDDLLSALMSVADGDEILTEAQIVTMCGLLLAAGNVTTTDLIGNGMLALLRHPDQLQKLRDDPSLMKNAVEEMLRYDGPVVETARQPLEDRVIAGCPVGARQSVVPHIAAANHDPTVYPDPHRFDITRVDTHHHSFGAGAHFCLGAPLARLEAQIAFTALLNRFSEIQLAPEPLAYRTLPGFQGVTRLNLVLSTT